MESARYRSHLSWIFILQLTFLTFLSTWHITLAQEVAIGEDCTGGKTCVGNATCNNNTNKCQCNPDYYNNSGVCQPKVAIGADCSGGKTCVENATCNNNTNKCQCNPDYYNNSGVCQTKVAIGADCSGGKTCVENATCNNNTNKCQCNPEYYNNSGVCQPKVAVGADCSGGKTCVDYATCNNSKCQCNPNYYNRSGVCQPKVGIGADCTGGQTCVDYATCNNDTNKCQCNPDYYNNSSVCQPKVAIGADCSGGKTCVDYATCNNNTNKCQCNPDHYNNSGVCQPKVAIGADCSLGKTCVDYATCNNSKCQCNPDYYNSSGVCQPKVAIGADCSGGKTCVENATCNNNTNKCQCNPDYYNNSGVCQPKIAIGADCSGGKTCVENAYCNSNNNKCQCNPDYYNNSGVCQPKVAIGADCSGGQTCVDYATCNNNKCQCNPDYYNNSGVCQPRLDYGMNCTSDNMCSWNLTCGAVSRCLCEGNLFRFANVCNSVTILKLADLSRSSTEEETLNVTWHQLNVGENISYNISLNSSEMQVVSSPFAVFTNKNPGTLYTASVTPSALKDPRYSDKRVSSDPITRSFYTKPAKPGELTDKVYAGPNGNLTFNPSKGNVDYYTVNISSYKAVNSSNSKAEVAFVNLTAGAFYDVTIVAVSGGITSDIREGNFRVQVELAGPVKDLVINNHGSRWVLANWMRPIQPNGVIYGYTVEVFPDGSSTCASGVAVVCSNCSYENYTVPSVMNCTVTETKNQTSDQLSAANTKQEVNVTSLLPDITYTVKVLAFNEKGEGKMADIKITTNMEAAQDLRELHVTPQPVGQLVVTWTPGERTGPTNYTLSWSEETALNSSGYANTSVRIFTDFNTRSYTITGLLSYWNYNISVQVVTPVGLPTEKHVINKTTESQPGAVSMFNISQPSDSSKELNFTVRCPAERERNGPITAIAYNSTFIDNQTAGPSGSVSVSDCEKDYFIVVPVTAEYNYTFNVFAKTDIYDGNLKSLPWSVKATAPKFVGSAGFNKTLLTTERAPSPTQNTATVIICPCLADTSHGNIVWMGLVVCKNSANRKCQSDGTSDYSSYLQKEVKTWKQFKDSNYEGSYRPTPDNYTITTATTRRKRSTFISRWARDVSAAGPEFIVGDDTTCEQQGPNVYCNGPLPDGTEFVVQAFACTAGGCTLAGEGITVVTIKIVIDRCGPGCIAGAVIGALAALIIIVVIIIFVMRRRKPKKAFHHVPSMRPAARRPIKLRDFKGHLDMLHSDSNLRFQEEFEEIQERSPKGYSQDAATTDANKVKNRYVNILPYDHTRVKLTTADDDETSDFINANYIPGFSSPREYIATQGPMTGTVDDFWRMIWEQKSGVIVMLSDLQEKGRPKVDLYWPTETNSPVQYGDIVVELKSTSTLNKYTIRDFVISMESQETRKVLQFFIPGWEDYSANLDSDDVLEFIQAVRQQARTSRGPVTVHCSAGVGRTGTFIALDFLMQYVNDNDLGADVDIYNLVLNMRHNRPHMVQSEKQYIFIHDTLKVIVDKKIKSMQENESIYMNTNGDENIYANTNQAFEPEENLYMNTDTWKPTTSL